MLKRYTSCQFSQRRTVIALSKISDRTTSFFLDQIAQNRVTIDEITQVFNVSDCHTQILIYQAVEERARKNENRLEYQFAAKLFVGYLSKNELLQQAIVANEQIQKQSLDNYGHKFEKAIASCSRFSANLAKNLLRKDLIHECIGVHPIFVKTPQYPDITQIKMMLVFDAFLTYEYDQCDDFEIFANTLIDAMYKIRGENRNVAFALEFCVNNTINIEKITKIQMFAELVYNKMEKFFYLVNALSISFVVKDKQALEALVDWNEKIQNRILTMRPHFNAMLPTEVPKTETVSIEEIRNALNYKLTRLEKPDYVSLTALFREMDRIAALDPSERLDPS